MSNKPNPEDFSVDERPRQYEAIINIQGTMRVTIMADSQEDANRQAEKMADDIIEDRETAELDDIDNIDVRSCRKEPPLFRVTRDGRKMKVGRLLSGDLPREPDERGF